MLTLLTCFATVAGLVVTPGPAAASSPASHVVGRITAAQQHRSGTVSVSGWAYDTARPTASVTVCLASFGRCIRTMRAAQASRTLDRRRHITGRHGFSATVHTRAHGLTLRLRASTTSSRVIAQRRVASVGARIVAYAKRFVGRVRYVEGGSTPSTGFDCSGYTAWVWAHEHVARLPHNAEAQRHAAHMRHISRAAARPGDLVFYLAGGSAYHVAIYAGHGKQYAAATPKDGLRYQPIWSSAIEFRTDWH